MELDVAAIADALFEGNAWEASASFADATDSQLKTLASVLADRVRESRWEASVGATLSHVHGSPDAVHEGVVGRARLRLVVAAPVEGETSTDDRHRFDARSSQLQTGLAHKTRTGLRRRAAAIGDPVYERRDTVSLPRDLLDVASPPVGTTF